MRKNESTNGGNIMRHHSSLLFVILWLFHSIPTSISSSKKRQWLTRRPSFTTLFRKRITTRNTSKNHDDSNNTTTTTIFQIPVVIGIDGGTESIRACCFHAMNGTIIPNASASIPYPTYHPRPGWAEQNPQDWYTNLGQAVQRATETILTTTDSNRQKKKRHWYHWWNHNKTKGQQRIEYVIRGICIDTTCCSVVMMDRTTGNALRSSILWMDQRSSEQSQRIMELCSNDCAIRINNNGTGPISAEWLLCKSLWLFENENALWNNPNCTICEYQDYINYQLTNVLCASSCNAATRWHWNGIDCIQEPMLSDDNDDNNDDESMKRKYPGRPISLYNRLGIPELVTKLPQRCIPMGQLVGYLTKEAAKHLGLSEGIPIIQGGPDAFVGIIGLGCIEHGQLCLITGSSHLHCIITNSSNSTSPKIWGTYRGVPLPTLNFAEGGQSSTGSLIRWVREKVFATTTKTYSQLDDEAAVIPPGCDGLVALETFQGSRTPITDPLARGALLGLTLSHTQAHICRALLEAVCFGTRACIEGLEDAGHTCTEIILAGGITRSKLWLQMHADVTGKPIIVCENCDAPLLGCAILAAVGVGIHPSVEDAVSTMVRTAQRIEPNSTMSAIYNILYEQVYSHVAESVRPITNALHTAQKDIRTIPHESPINEKSTASNTAAAATTTTTTTMSSSDGLASTAEEALETVTSLSGGDTNQQHEQIDMDSNDGIATIPTIARATKLETNNNDDDMVQDVIIISPSLLACDWVNIGQEMDKCMNTGLRRFHVDIFDGVFLNSPYALTFGPQMVQAIRRRYSRNDTSDGIELDLHVCVERPARYVIPLADAGGTRFIFQYEAFEDNIDDAFELIHLIVKSGMKCGISINPETTVDKLYPLLQTGLIDLVDILAVEPGFGGQVLQPIAFEKIRTLKEWRDSNFDTTIATKIAFHIMVDGGVNEQTVHDIKMAGADIIVAGSYLFQNPIGVESGIDALRSIYHDR